jgi:hypothetical protein
MKEVSERRSKRSLIKLVCLMGLLTMAFATAASAAQASEWLIRTPTGTKTLKEVGGSAATESFNVSIPSGSHISINWEFSELPITGRCSTVTAIEGVLRVGGTGGGSLKFGGCEQEKPEGCISPPNIGTKSLAFSIVEIAGREVLKIAPSSTTEPTLLGTLTLQGSCALAGTPFKITGSFGLIGLTPGKLMSFQKLEGAKENEEPKPRLEIAGQWANIGGGPIEMELTGKNLKAEWGISS